MITYKEVAKKITQGDFDYVDKHGDNLLQSLIKNEEFATIPLAPVQQLLKKRPDLAMTPDAHGLFPLQLLENAHVKARKNRHMEEDDPGVVSNRPLKRLLYKYTENAEQKKLLSKGGFISFVDQINGTKNKEEKDGAPMDESAVQERLNHPCLLIFPGLEGHTLSMVKSTGRIIRKALGIYNQKIPELSVIAVRCPGNEKDFANDYQLYHHTLSSEQWKEKIDDFITPFVHTFLRPLYLSEKGEKLPVKSAQKKVRKLNFIGYCRGAYIIQEIANTMYKDMISKGFTEEEAKKIQSQMLAFNIASDLTKEHYKTNMRSYHFIQTHDDVVGNYVSQIFPKSPVNGQESALTTFPEQPNQQVFLVNTLENNTHYDPHTLDTYFNPANTAQKQALNWMKHIVLNGIDNSIQNQNSDSFIPLLQNLAEPTEKFSWLSKMPSEFYLSSRIKFPKLALSKKRRKTR